MFDLFTMQPVNRLGTPVAGVIQILAARAASLSRDLARIIAIDDDAPPVAKSLHLKRVVKSARKRARRGKAARPSGPPKNGLRAAGILVARIPASSIESAG